MKISVVIPAYNEEKVIRKTLMLYADFLAANFDQFELIAVNDGSTDSTLAEIKKCRLAHVISYNKNRGKGYAVKRGFLRATGDYIFFTDADCSYEPQNILHALSVLKSGNFRGILGVRKNRNQEYPFLRRLMSVGLSRILKSLLFLDNPDTQCGFKGFDKQTAKRIFSMTEIFDFGFDFEIIYLSKMLKKPLASLSVSFIHRTDSRVKLFSDFFKIIRDIFRIRQRKVFN